MDNRTLVTEVILLGFSEDLKVNVALFLFFLTIYLITIIGNCLIICVSLMNPCLHRPMYFFLCNLSFIDICYSTAAVPRLLTDLLSLHRIISALACGAQLYTILFIGMTECQLLVLMAYDRFIAICRPLHYPVLMRWSACFRLVAFVWICSFTLCILPSLLMPMTLCNPNQINHFACELVAIIKLSCGDISLSELVIFCISFITLLLPFFLIIISYICIISSVLKIRATTKYKAFSTCSSHIIVVVLYFSAGMNTYFGPSSQYSSDREKYISVFYVVVCPMINPLIYSLNNREVRKSLETLFTRHIDFSMTGHH